MAIETITVINNSGKIISNFEKGKHLLALFKEAKSSYQEKRAAVKAERAVERSVKRSNTFDVATVPRYYEEVEYIQPSERRISHDDAHSQASSRRSHRSRQTRSRYERSRSRPRPALTASNLQTLSEVSSTAPSRAPVAYRSPYAETIPWDPAMSRPTLVHAPTMPVEHRDAMAPAHHQSTYVVRSRSDPALAKKKKVKEIDMDLAYGNIPPDLESRVDLDPAYRAAEKEQEAHTLTERIEGLLVEAHCVHHTASHMIKHLQENPDAAAAVALTLAELSTLLKKMSPSFLGAIQASSPAVFALLASPQFLIAAGLTVGVTVVMFGGWKIVKRIKAEQAAAAANALPARPMAFEAYPDRGRPYAPTRADYPRTEVSDGFDEALVLEEELSTIETWRRGIAPYGEDDDESADLELISPEAMRSQYGGDDARTVRSARTTRTTRTQKSHKSTKSRRDRAADDMEVPERRSSRGVFQDAGADNDSQAGSERSHRSHRSHQSSKSKRTERTTLKAIEDGSKDRENSLEAVLRPKKENMLKNMFKKKKEREEKSTRVESVMA
ncbi:hypothetical protein BX600DRAFT_511719 [Xylariales sp. PMI_506]|nr:hypothetical protein BX600DRAFT_511719 [Xylariales sp. PMI_506]